MRDPAHPVAPAAEVPVGTPAQREACARVAERVQQWLDAPWALDYFAAMRRLEALAAPQPRWGEAARPVAEPLRIGQSASLSFAPASIEQFEAPTGGAATWRMRQPFFSYLGPNGPLPIHLSELVRDRAHNHGDTTWLAFLDAFLHRFALHFYRAWTRPRPAVGLDRPGDDPWRRWVGSLVGVGTPARQGRDAIPDDARLHFSGWLARRVHCAEGVEAVIGGYFNVATRLERWVGHWLVIAPQERSRLTGIAAADGGAAQRLGGVVLGHRVWDRQHAVRLHLGPLSLARYRQFLPTGSALPALRGWMQQLLGDELHWDAQLILDQDEVPPTRLGQHLGNAPRLGWVSWLGEQPRRRHAADVRMSAHATTPHFENTRAVSSYAQEPETMADE